MSDFIDLSLYEVPDVYHDITIEHLLTMSSGIEWDTYNISGEYIALKASMDPLAHILSRRRAFDPGDQFNYSDGTAHLVAEVLYRATGQKPIDYANDRLFGPLGIENALWSTAEDGVNMGGCDLHLSCEDMRKIGTLVLNGGVFEGQRIISEDWLEESMIQRMSTYSSADHNNAYGYFWWLGHESGYDIVSALGHGGQFLILVPDLEIVITASTIGGVSDAMASRQFYAVEQLLYGTLLPYIIDQQDVH